MNPNLEIRAVMSRQLVLFALFVLAPSACMRHAVPVQDARRLDTGTTALIDCEPDWVRKIPRDSVSFFFAELGSGFSREAAMDRAWQRAAASYVRQVSSVVTDNAEYVKRHGSVEATTSAVRRFLTNTTMASALELVERSRFCETSDGYSVWELRRVSISLTVARLAEVDPLAADIDFREQLKRALRWR